MENKENVEETLGYLEKKLCELEKWPNKVSKQREDIVKLNGFSKMEMEDLTYAMLCGVEYINTKEKGKKRISELFENIIYEKTAIALLKNLAYMTPRGRDIQKKRNLIQITGFMSSLFLSYLIGEPMLAIGMLCICFTVAPYYKRKEINSMIQKFDEYMPKFDEHKSKK